METPMRTRQAVIFPKVSVNCLKYFRRRANLSLAEMARRLNKKRRSIIRYENGERGINAILAHQISDVLNADVSCLITGKNKQVKVSYRDYLVFFSPATLKRYRESIEKPKGDENCECQQINFLKRPRVVRNRKRLDR
jgi:transcriptional regulator with XRE-family HTH domain